MKKKIQERANYIVWFVSFEDSVNDLMQQFAISENKAKKFVAKAIIKMTKKGL